MLLSGYCVSGGRGVVALVLVFVLLPPLSFTHAADEWHLLHPTIHPSMRVGAGMTFDSASRRVVLFGGFDMQLERYLADTWTWDGTTWHQESPTSSPPARSARGALAYDSAGRRSVLFGGEGENTTFADTWTWDGSNWQVLSAATFPAARRNHALASLGPSGGILLFGGYADRKTLGDCW